MKLERKVAIVTGSSSGLGRAVALDFAKEGADVVVNGRNKKRAEEVAEEIKAMNQQALVVIADVTSSLEVNHMTRTVLDKFGKIDILINNAGGSARENASYFHESSENVWDMVISTNLRGTMICTRAVIPHMIERRVGNIINISSVAGVIGEAGMVEYSAAKAGVIGFTKALAKEVGPYGIRVNAVSPGVIRTPWILKQEPQLLEKLSGRVLLGRLGEPEEVADFVTFLASDCSKFMTGENFIISGGSKY